MLVGGGEGGVYGGGASPATSPFWVQEGWKPGRRFHPVLGRVKNEPGKLRVNTPSTQLTAI